MPRANEFALPFWPYMEGRLQSPNARSADLMQTVAVALHPFLIWRYEVPGANEFAPTMRRSYKTETETETET